ncbi:DNAH7 [Symbiodinium necroappetens]|uniref:DNAH7 protein n=1 Tax=Symbiodinium necroappetens TaxID=1628268 RepID=A0A812R548_9DINO|nr:DNAH7 [Symbiodinium necroappetens]
MRVIIATEVDFARLSITCKACRDLLLSFRSLLPTQPAGCTLPWLVPTETVWEPWWRTPKRRARRAEPKLPEEAPAGDPTEALQAELVQEVLPDLPQPAPEDQDFLAASVRSRGRKRQPAVQVVCSFHARAWPGARRRREQVPTEDSQDSPQEKPSRLSMAPTVHDAHCKDSDESEVISSPLSEEEPWSAPVDSAPRQEINEPSPQAEVAEAEVTRLQAELEELQGTLTRERALRDEAETAQSRASKRLSSAEGRAAQLATQLQRCKVERDELRRQLHEKSEIHVELTRKLRKVQEANRSLDSELNKTEALRLAAQNRAAAAQEARGQAEALLDSLRDLLRNVDEVDSAQAAVSLTKVKEQLEGFATEPQLSAPKTKDPEAEEELPTAGGLLREWASVYDNAEDARRDPPAGPVLLQQRSPSWNKATKSREVPSSSPPSARGAGEQLAQLSLRDLSEIKALKKPPPPIRMLMEVCCLLFHIQPVKHLDEQCVHHRLRTDYWEPARRYLLSDPFLLSKLRSHGKDIGPPQRAKIKKYFKDPEFSAERMLKCSRARALGSRRLAQGSSTCGVECLPDVVWLCKSCLITRRARGERYRILCKCMLYVCIHACTYGWTDGWMDRWTFIFSY